MSAGTTVEAAVRYYLQERRQLGFALKSQYQSVAQVSKATATRHLSDLLEKGCLRRLPGGGRSTRYQINQPGSTLPGLETE